MTDDAELLIEDRLRDAIAAVFDGTPYLPPGALVTDVVVAYGFIDPESGNHGSGNTYAGAPWSALGLLHTAMDEWNDDE